MDMPLCSVKSSLCRTGEHSEAHLFHYNGHTCLSSYILDNKAAARKKWSDSVAQLKCCACAKWMGMGVLGVRFMNIPSPVALKSKSSHGQFMGGVARLQTHTGARGRVLNHLAGVPFLWA